MSLAGMIGMTRDYRKVAAFHEADALVLATYEISRGFASEERFGLQSQLRRAAISVATNIIEGSTRPSLAEYCRFLYISHGSARECAYLFDVSARLGLLPTPACEKVRHRYDRVCAMLIALAKALQRLE